MKTSRTDIKRDKRIVKCFNSSLLGYSTYTLKAGDVFLFRYKGDIEHHIARSHGRAKPLNCNKYHILAQQLSDNLQFSYERWIDPEDVIEIIPAQHVEPLLLEMFKKYEKLQEYGK